MPNEWRRKNPDKRRLARKQNYQLGRTNLSHSGHEWTCAELDRITAADRPHDRQLAVELGRSVQAIQVQRTRCFGRKTL